VSGDESCMSGAYPESPTLRGTCNGGTSVACPVTNVAFPTKHGKNPTLHNQCLVSDNLHITNVEFVQHVWPRVEESYAIWPAAKIELGKTH